MLALRFRSYGSEVLLPIFANLAHYLTNHDALQKFSRSADAVSMMVADRNSLIRQTPTAPCSIDLSRVR